MAKIDNSLILTNVRSDLKLLGFPSPISETEDKVRLTYDVHLRKIMNVIDNNNAATTQTAATIYTTSATRDTYLHGISITWVSDVTADNTILSISAKIDPQTSGSTILSLNKFTTTATQFEKVIIFPIPIKLTKNTTITQTNTFTVGGSSVASVLYMSEEDVPMLNISGN